MHKQTVCKILNRFQHGKYLVAYVLKQCNLPQPDPIGIYTFLKKNVITIQKSNSDFYLAYGVAIINI